MRKTRLTIVPIFLVLLLVLGTLLVVRDIWRYEPDPDTAQLGSTVTLESTFFIPERFWSGVKEATPVTIPSTVSAVLVPHHLLAGELISEIFSGLKAQGVKKIIIVGPNHYEKGLDYVQYNSTDWKTALGGVKGFKLLPDINDTEVPIMNQEHSIAGLVPYVAHYTPHAQVFSIIFKHNTKDEELEALAKRVVEGWDANTVLIASVDFSHYLPMAVAEERDNYTRQVLLSMNEQLVYPLNNDYLDSPASVALMLKVCKGLGSKTFTILTHANSAEILGNPRLQSTTSYFIGYCT